VTTQRPPLEPTLRAARDAGRKLFLPYMTGGLGEDWLDVVRAYAAAGADAIEIGIPFSDPVMDGPTIQEASERALRAGATPVSVLRDLADLDVSVPLVVMTYYNLAFHAGHERFAHQLTDSGVGGCILPDLPLEESGPWCTAADAAGVATVLLAAPTAPDERLPRICERSRGFVYAVGLVGVTGERSTLAASTTVMAKRLKAVTDRPVVAGIGISSAEQAVEACTEADGIVMASAIMRLILDGGGPDEAGAFAAEVRAAIDRG
jgi:tryptophan synthase alpha chain